MSRTPRNSSRNIEWRLFEPFADYAFVSKMLTCPGDSQTWRYLPYASRRWVERHLF
ncbi:hypothetical protein FIBSPDRAFT_873463 [Athelia psychrophila]|uniref:Uncharacterized protein n=1 Tax=Athelia psychrophila TaxID=1759441 RepID=A0A165YJ23_9AGAM|nr:hypothetical protein FIBSPDRAFT_873463 [Fibularhizoctonia sp. CBS 109695]